MSLPLPLGQDGLRNLRCASCVQDDSRCGVDEETAFLTAEERLWQQTITPPGYAGVKLAYHAISAALTLAMRLVERVLSSSLWGQLVNVPLDELQVEFGV